MGAQGISAEPEYHDSTGRPGGLNDDEAGSGGTSGHAVYHPPGGRRPSSGGQDNAAGRPQEDVEVGWDYRDHGEDWGHIGDCGLLNQSPVDLPLYIDTRGQTKHLLWFDYYLDPDLEQNHRAKVVNDGHGIYYDVATNQIDLGFVKVGDTEYMASDWTFHTPSEHTFDGAVLPLEVQIINKQRGGEALVGVSVLFKEGASNAFLASLRDGMNGQAPIWTPGAGPGVGSVSGVFAGAFDLEALIPKSGPQNENAFYNYQGALTQPPCTQGVDWWVLSSPVTATREEIRFIRHGILQSESSRHGNARATMPMNDRPVWSAIVGFQHAVKFHNMPEWLKKDSYQEPRGYSSQDMPWGNHWNVEISEPEAESKQPKAPAPSPAAAATAAPGPATPPGLR